MKIGVLGVGSIGSRHLQNLIQIGYPNIIAFDTSAERLSDVEKRGARVVKSLDEFWSAVPEVVFITTGTASHVDLARKACTVASAVFIEKPLSFSTTGIAELIDSARNLTTMVGCNMRFHPGPRRLKKELADATIGNVLSARLHTGSFLPRWRPGSDYRQSYSASPVHGGAVLDCIHEIDLAVWLFGKAELKHCTWRRATSIEIQTDGLAEILLQHSNGSLSSVHLNFVQRNYHRGIEIIGTEGTLSWNYNKPVVVRYDDKGVQHLIEQWEEGWDSNIPYLEEVVYFLDRVRSGEKTFNEIQEAADVLELALQVRSKENESV